MDFGPESEAALREFTLADSELADAKLRGLPDRGGLERRVERARAALDPFYARLVVRALPPDDMDALVAEHPPTDEDKAKAKERGGDAAWSPATFGPALLAACVSTEDDPDKPAMSADEWSEITSSGPVSSGELRYLLTTALDINDRTPDPTLGKG